MDDLTPKQKLFVAHYLACHNGTEAAIKAGYSEKTAAVIASQNLTKLNIRTAIDEGMRQIMPAAEVVSRLADQARSSLRPFVRRDRDGDLIGFDLGDDKPLHLIRKIKITRRKEREVTIETIDFELYDAHAALVDIGRIHGLFVDKTALTDPTGTKPYDDADAIAQRLFNKLGTRSSTNRASDVPDEPDEN